MNRIVNWHIPCNGASLPAFYIEQDYTPSKVRIYAEDAPTGEFEVEIRDDGSSIFVDQAASYHKYHDTASIISYSTLDISTFKEGEGILGGTSGATAIALEGSKFGNIKVKLIGNTVFTVAETITGGDSSTTAVVTAFYRGWTDDRLSADPVRKSVVLPKGENLEEHAEDLPDSVPIIEEGSILTCYVINMGSANNVTVQLELLSLDEEEGD